MTIIRNAHVVTPGKDLGVADVIVDGEKVDSVGSSSSRRNPSGCDVAQILEATGLTLLPGFVDIHSHGRSGFDFADATDEAFETMGRDRLKDGVTGFLATGLTLSEEQLAEMCRCAERYKEKCAFRRNAPTGERATCLGIHLEGPFFNPECAGAQNPAYLKLPDPDFVFRLNEISPVKKVSLSPELEGGIDCIKALVAHGIVASGGHSAADYACFQRAYAAGMTHATHFCNVVTPLHHLRPGFVGGGLLAKDLYVEMICDGVHLTDPMIEIIARMKGPDRLMIITDSMRAAGCPDGDYSLGGLPVVVAGGCARVKNADGTPGPIAGSTGLFHKGFQRLARVTGWPLHEVVKAAGYNQLRSLGITDRGEIVPGQIADFVLVDGNLDPVATIARGQVAWEKAKEKQA